MAHIQYNASPTLTQFHKSDAFVRGIRGPVGSGKSVGCCMEGFLIGQNMIPCADGWKKSKGLVVRNTLPELESTTIKTWLEWFPEEKFGKMRRKPPYEHIIKIPSLKLYMEVMFLALDKAEDVKKLLSYEGTWIWFNEAREINYEIVSAATGRVGRYPSMREAPQEIKDLGVEGIKFVQELTVNPDPDVAAKRLGLKKKEVAKIQAMPGFNTALKWMLQRYIIMDTNPPDDEHWWYRMAENDEWAVDQRGEKVDPASIPVHNQWKFFSQPSGLSDNAENIENL